MNKLPRKKKYCQQIVLATKVRSFKYLPEEDECYRKGKENKRNVFEVLQIGIPWNWIPSWKAGTDKEVG